MTGSQFALLRSRRFLPLFVTQFLGALNDNFFKNALVILVTYRLAQQVGRLHALLASLNCLERRAESPSQGSGASSGDGSGGRGMITIGGGGTDGLSFG